MPYLNLDLDYFTHPKVLALEDVLGEVAVMYPVKLWCYAGKHFAQTGILTSCTKLSIEKALGWSGEPGKLVDALVKISFIDVKKSETESENFTYRIHDWKHHAGHLGAFKRRAITAAKTRWQKYASSKRQADDKQALAYALGSSSPSSSSPSLQEDKEKIGRKNGQAKKPKRLPAPLPPDFAFTKDMKDWALAEGWPEPFGEFEQFCDHARKTGIEHLDWQAAYRTWIRNAIKWAKEKAHGKNLQNLR